MGDSIVSVILLGSQLCYLVENNAGSQNQTFVKPCESEG